MPRDPVILASSSPRRAFFLKAMGIPFRAIAPDIDERRRASESARRYVRRVALDKALAVSRRHQNAWVIAGDTAVVIEGALLGKPKDARDARRMLRTLSGRKHHVLSGIALAHGHRGACESAVSSTRVTFRSLSPELIRWYVRTGEPLDKAGAYGLQEKGGLLVTRLEGSYSNVIGFPLEKFYELWSAAGLPLPD